MSKLAGLGPIDLSKANRLFPLVDALPSGQAESFGRFMSEGLPQLWESLFPVELGGMGYISLKSFEARTANGGVGVEVSAWLSVRTAESERVFEVTMRFPTPRPDGSFVVDGQELAFPAVLEGPTSDLRSCRLHWADRALRSELEVAMARFTSAMAEMVRQGNAGSLSADELARMFPIQACIDSFFTSNPGFQRIDDTNPLSRATHLRRVRRVVEPGVSIPAAQRALDGTHYGRLDFVETPEGPNIGLVHTMALWSQVDAEGNVLTPYEAVEGGQPTGRIEYMSAERDFDAAKAPWDFSLPKEEGGAQPLPYAWVRQREGFGTVDRGDVSYMEVSPVQGLGLSTLLMPFLGSDDANRALMGANMLRQAISVEGREVPWVMSGAEEPLALWTGAPEEFLIEGCLALGANALVAYLPWRGYNYEDAIVVSQAFVDRDVMTSLRPGGLRHLQVGDKLANRHGSKGVVSLIVPTDQMPRLPDGTPVDVLLNPLGVPSRMVFGALLETAAGLAAWRLGRRVISPPYCGATRQEVRELLESAGLPGSGMLELTDPATGRVYDNPVAVGMQYLLKLNHMAEDKLVCGRQRIGSMEIMAMVSQGASAMVRDALRDGDCPGSTAFEGLARVMECAGISMEPGIAYGFARPEGLRARHPKALTSPWALKGLRTGEAARVDLPTEIPHPWVEGQFLSVLTLPPCAMLTQELVGLYAKVIEAAANYRDLKTSGAPSVLVEGSGRRLKEAVNRLLGPTDGSSGIGALIVGLSKRVGRSQRRSFRSVIVPGPDMRLSDCGVPVDAWSAVLDGGPRAAGRVLLNLAPTLGTRSLQTLTAVVERSRAVRIHPLLCVALDADFDGDQVAIYGFGTKEGLDDGQTLFSPARNLCTSAEGELLVFPTQEMVYGLAYLTAMHGEPGGSGEVSVSLATEADVLRSLEEGAVRLHQPVLLAECGQVTTPGRVLFASRLPSHYAGNARITGVEVNKGLLRAFLQDVAGAAGASAALELAEGLMRLGFEYATRSGISVGLGSIPEELDSVKAALREEGEAMALAAWEGGRGTAGVLDAWEACFSGIERAVHGALAEASGPPRELLRMVESGARGTMQQMSQLLGARGLMRAAGRGGFFPIASAFADGTSAWAHFSSGLGWRECVGECWARGEVRARLGNLLLIGLQDITDGGKAAGLSAAFALTEPLIMMDTTAHEAVEAVLLNAVGLREAAVEAGVRAAALEVLVGRLADIYARAGINLDRSYARIAVLGLAGVWRTGRVLESLVFDAKPLAVLGQAAADGRVESDLGTRERLMLGYEAER